MQIKATMRYHVTTVRMSINKKSKKISAGEGVEKRELFNMVGGNVNWCCLYGEQYGGPLKNLK